MSYRLTLRAEADLAGIFERSFELFGPRQAERYRDGLKACFDLIAANPQMGRTVRIRPGLRRHEHREVGSDVLIVTVLHRRRLPAVDAL